MAGVKVSGSKLDDNILIDSGDDTIKAGNGNDIIYAGGGNDVITGGKGNNVITLTNFINPEAGFGNDIVNLTKGENLVIDCKDYSTFEAKVDGKNVVLTFSETESITLKNFASKDVVGSKGSIKLKLNGSDELIDLRTQLDYVAGAFSSKGAYSGKWLSEVIDASGIETAFDKKGTKGVSVKAGAGEDTITGSQFNDTLYGGNDTDKIIGGEGADLIKGDKGDDELYGNAGDDKMYGGDGYDYINGGAGNDLIKGEKGESWLVGGTGNDTIEGGSDYDYIQGGADADLIKANSGDDYIEGDEGADTIYGGNGNDTIVASTYLETVPAGVKTVTDYYNHFLADENAKTIDGGKGNDVIWGSAGADTIKGGDGNDDLFVFGENSVTYAGSGDDLINLYAQTNKTAYGDKGNDTISIEFGSATVEGGAGNDAIWGGFVTESDIVFKKGSGHDLYLYRGALKTKNAGDTTVNADTLVFENISASALSFNQDGDNLVISYGKNDSVTVENYYKYLGADDLTYKNNNGAYLVESGKWEIYIQTKDGGKVLLSDMIKSYYGTTGSNKITTDKEVVNALAGNDKVTLTGNGQVVYAGEGKDTVYGGEGDNEIYGEDGNDVIYGGAGNEYIEGGLGADSIYGGEGNDTIMSSTYLYGEIPAGTPTVTDYYSKFLADGSANVIDSGNGDDRIWGSNGADTINAGAGNDKVYAFGEGSVIDLGDGDDLSNLYQNTAKTLHAGAGNDTVSIEYGKATVTGGTGDDSIWGGYVSDSTYIFTAGDGNDLYRYRGYTTSSGTGTPTYCSDTLVFENISVDDMTFAKDGEKLVITYADNSSVALDSYFKDGVDASKWNVYIETTEGKALLSDMVGLQNLLLKLATPEGAIAGTIANDTFTADKTSAVAYGYQGDDTFNVSSDWIDRRNLPETIPAVTFDGGAGNDTFNVGQGTFGVTMTGGAGADTFNLYDTWTFDTYWSESLYAKGPDTTITDFGKDDTLIIRQGNANNMFAPGVDVNTGEYGHAKYTMFFEVTADGKADLSKVMFALEDRTTVKNNWNDETNKSATSFVIKTEEPDGSILDTGKIIVRNGDVDTEYKFNEDYINDLTSKVAAWLTSDGRNYGSVSEAMAAGDKDVLVQFVDASLPFNQPDGYSIPGGYDILVPVV